MSQYTFTTRAYGPSAKGSTLTWEDLDYSLLFLSESIDAANNDILSGSNYLFVKADGTPSQNATELSASYVQAKNSSPSATNRIAILVSPGEYTFASDFNLNTQYIDVVSLTGECDVLVTGSGTIIVGNDNMFVRGINVDVKNFTITGSLPSVVIKNCKGGDESFGGYPPPTPGDFTSPGYFIASTFIDCVGGDYSFASNGSAYGTFINCVGGDYSFGQFCDGTFSNCVGGDYSFAWEGNIEGGLIENCTGGIYSFASIGDIGSLIETATVKNCTGGLNSFAQGISNVYGLLQNCKLTSGNFNSTISNVIANTGAVVSCIDASNNSQNS
jgi:hypothetical protein